MPLALYSLLSLRRVPCFHMTFSEVLGALVATGKPTRWYQAGQAGQLALAAHW